jgi:uncharacterized protein
MPRLDYFAPGVYVEEISRGSRPIEGVNMSVAGFVGFTEDIQGDAELFEPMLVTSWSQYLDYFAKPGSTGFTSFGAYLPFAVKGWFDNGGGRCWVVSMGTQLPYDESTATTNEQSEEITDETAITIVKTSGKRESLSFRLKEGQEENRRLKVVIEKDEPRSETGDEEPFDTGEYFKIRLFNENQEPLKEPDPTNPGKQRDVEYRHLTMKQNSESGYGTYVGQALENSNLLTVEVLATEGFPLSIRPANGVYDVKAPREIYPKSHLYQKVYGSQKGKTGVQGLFEIDEVAMIACPDLMLAFEKGLITLGELHGLMEMMIVGCENSAPSPPYRMVVFDPPPVKPRKGDNPVSPDRQTPQDVETWLMDSFGRRSQFAALYYPWIQVINPSDSKLVYVPPCGHMMGLWCQTDETRGIYKAPANVVPRGVLNLAYNTNFREQELLNPKGINCIRKFRDRGTLVWGARTLAESNDIDWRYISVRRLMSYISKSIELGTQWAVFEPNDEDLWARVTRTVTNFLERLWREGALFGGSPEQAFYVKCDSELNTPDTMRLGRLYVEIGVCPVRPAEFVIFRISQWNGVDE